MLRWLRKLRPDAPTSARQEETPAKPLSRNEKLLQGCNMEGVGLEIGASYRPVAPKKAGYRVEVLDHASADDLREKYKNQNVDVSNIEEVDYVWSGEPLHELIGKTDHYDWIVASHVVEHTPDLISFLNQSEAMLKPGGLLCLAVPDHRYCFDIFRPVSTPGSIIQAFLEKRNRHTLASIWDHFSMITRKGDQVAWYNGHPGEYQPMHQVDEVSSMFQRAQQTGEYIDVHNWVFTPASFRLVMMDIGALDYTRLHVCTFFPTDGCEFIVQLKKEVGKTGKTEKLPNPDLRRQLLLSLLEEH